MSLIGDKIENAIQPSSEVEAAKASEFVLLSCSENIGEIDKRVSHRVILMITLCIIYELSVRTSIERITLFGVGLASTEAMRLAVPVMVSYLYFLVAYLIIWRRVQLEAYRVSLKLTYPHVNSFDVSLFTLHPSILYFIGSIVSFHDAKSARLMNVLWGVIGFTAVFAPLAFIAYGIWNYFRFFGPQWWVILAILSCFVFLLPVFILAFTTNSLISHGDVDQSAAQQSSGRETS